MFRKRLWLQGTFLVCLSGPPGGHLCTTIYDYKAFVDHLAPHVAKLGEITGKTRVLYSELGEITGKTRFLVHSWYDIFFSLSFTGKLFLVKAAGFDKRVVFKFALRRRRVPARDSETLSHWESCEDLTACDDNMCTAFR